MKNIEVIHDACLLLTISCHVDIDDVCSMGRSKHLELLKSRRQMLATIAPSLKKTRKLSEREWYVTLTKIGSYYATIDRCIKELESRGVV